MKIWVVIQTEYDQTPYIKPIKYFAKKKKAKAFMAERQEIASQTNFGSNFSYHMESIEVEK